MHEGLESDRHYARGSHRTPESLPLEVQICTPDFVKCALSVTPDCDCDKVKVDLVLSTARSCFFALGPYQLRPFPLPFPRTVGRRLLPCYFRSKFIQYHKTLPFPWIHIHDYFPLPFGDWLKCYANSAERLACPISHTRVTTTRIQITPLHLSSL